MKKCKWFGHKWQIVYIRKGEKWKFIACYCERCNLGYQELLDFVDKNSPIINTYEQKYFMEEQMGAITFSPPTLKFRRE